MAKSFESDAVLFSKDKNKKKAHQQETRTMRKAQTAEKLLMATLKIEGAIDVVKSGTSRKTVE